MNTVKKVIIVLSGLLMFLWIAGCEGTLQEDPDMQNAIESSSYQSVNEEQSNKETVSGETLDSTISELRVHFIDVGQGDCTLIESKGEYMLIDAGSSQYGSYIIEYLQELGVEKFAYVIGTHPHEDHIGALAEIIYEFPIETFLLPDTVHTTQTFEDVLNAVEDTGLEITTAEAGTQFTLGDSKFTVVSPGKDYGESLNNWSVSIVLTNGEHRFLLCGDLEEEGEADILEAGFDISADVYKVNHHGSKYSSSEAFLNAADPLWAVISCGADNSYGHPHEEVLEALADRGVTVFRTDEGGTLIASSSNGELTWEYAGYSYQSNSTSDSKDKETVNEYSTSEETVEETETEQSAEKDSNETQIYIGNINTKKLHLPTCKSLPDEKNRVEFIDREEAISNGYEPCKLCNP